jgi:hypothetical protein
MIDLLSEDDKKDAIDDVSSANTQSELDKLMGEYSEAKVMESNESVSSVQIPSESEIPLDSNLRFKRGKKKGELKPNWQDLWKKENEGKGQTPQAQPKEFSPSENVVISGALIMLMLNIVLPVAIKTTAKIVFKKNLDSDILKLSKKESDELSPLAEQAAAYLNLKVNPVTAFVLAITSVYTAKVIEASTTKPKEENAG